MFSSSSTTRSRPGEGCVLRAGCMDRVWTAPSLCNGSAIRNLLGKCLKFQGFRPVEDPQTWGHPIPVGLFEVSVDPGFAGQQADGGSGQLSEMLQMGMLSCAPGPAGSVRQTRFLPSRFAR